jgi:1,4-alpha-glucan branching enzyme
LRSRQIEIVHSSDSDRMIAFRRWQGAENHLVIASFSNHPKVPCRIHSSRLGEERWREIFNSDAARFGGTNLGHLGGVIHANDGVLECLPPANSLLVFERL